MIKTVYLALLMGFYFPLLLLNICMVTLEFYFVVKDFVARNPAFFTPPKIFSQFFQNQLLYNLFFL